jgi:hypothetical protein
VHGIILISLVIGCSSLLICESSDYLIKFCRQIINPVMESIEISEKYHGYFGPPGKVWFDSLKVLRLFISSMAGTAVHISSIGEPSQITERLYHS